MSMMREGPSNTTRSSELCGSHGTTLPGVITVPLGLGPVGLEELVVDAPQLALDDGAAEGIEGHLAEPHALEALGEEDLALVPLVLGLGSTPSGSASCSQ